MNGLYKGLPEILASQISTDCADFTDLEAAAFSVLCCRTKEKGQRRKDKGERRKEKGQWTMDNGQWTMEKGERRKDKGERRKEKGERRKEKGERRKEKGPFLITDFGTTLLSYSMYSIFRSYGPDSYGDSDST